MSEQKYALEEQREKASGAETAVPVAASDLTGDLIAGMPEVTKPNAEKETVKPALNEQKVPFEIDAKGVTFDPFVHRADENGKPVRNKHGRFYSKFLGRAGSKRRSEGAGNIPPATEKGSNDLFEEAPKFEGLENPQSSAPPQSDQPAQQPDEFQGMALLTVPTVDGAMQTLFGPDIALSKEEMERLTPFVSAYLRQKGFKELSPGWALALISVAVYAPKFQKPTVKQQIVVYYLKIKGWFSKAKK